MYRVRRVLRKTSKGGRVASQPDTSSQVAGSVAQHSARARLVLSDESPPHPSTPRIIFGYRDGVTVLALVGEHDWSTADDLAAAIDHECSLNRGVVISFSEADFIDSAVIRTLFAADKKMIAEGRRLVLHTNPLLVCDRLLELVGAHDSLLCTDLMREATTLASQQYLETPSTSLG